MAYSNDGLMWCIYFWPQVCVCVTFDNNIWPTVMTVWYGAYISCQKGVCVCLYVRISVLGWWGGGGTMTEDCSTWDTTTAQQVWILFISSSSILKVISLLFFFLHKLIITKDKQIYKEITIKLSKMPMHCADVAFIFFLLVVFSVKPNHYTTLRVPSWKKLFCYMS